MKKIILILSLCSLCVCVGFAVAYYNTSSLGYDNANIISVSKDELRLFDVYINYNDIKELFKIIRKILSDNFITISWRFYR